MRTRLVGLLVFAVGVLLATWLYELVHDLPYRHERPQHLLLGAAAFLALTVGAALTFLGSDFIRHPED